MQHFWDSIGNYVVGHMDPVLSLYGLFALGAVGVLLGLVSTAVYAFGRAENIKNSLLRFLYTLGQYQVERIGRGGGVYQGGSPVALIGMSCIIAAIAIACAAVFYLGLTGALLLGGFIYVPALAFFVLVFYLIVNVKAHLKRWGWQEHTLDMPQRFPRPFDNANKGEDRPA